jgi:hypothetical protein
MKKGTIAREMKQKTRKNTDGRKYKTNILFSSVRVTSQLFAAVFYGFFNSLSFAAIASL